MFLDRHNAECDKGSVMTQLHLNNSGGQWQWEYKCAPSERQLTYRTAATPMNADGGGNLYYLDRHDVLCNSNEALTQIKLARNSAGNQYQLQYTCAS